MSTPTTGAAELPEALRLAEILEGDYCPDWFYEQGVDEAAAELRRLHAENERLAALVEAQQPAPSAAAAPSVSDGQRALHEAILNRLSHAELLEKAHYLMELNSNQARTIGELQDLVESAPQPSPTPQADSQPAPVRNDREAFIRWHMDYLHTDEMLAAHVWDSDHVVAQAYRAARAPADSVTAPVRQGKWTWVPVEPSTAMLVAGNHGQPGDFSALKVWQDMLGALERSFDYTRPIDPPSTTPPAQAADSVLEDAACEAIDKVLALFPFNATTQAFTIGGGPHLTADGDTEFYSVKRVLAFLTEIKTTLDAARKQGANHD